MYFRNLFGLLFFYVFQLQDSTFLKFHNTDQELIKIGLFRVKKTLNKQITSITSELTN
jgi:hypothetical protein